MPIYEYACETCGKHVELIQKVNDAPLTVCPECGKTGLHRLLSAPSFQLKGQGWYVTDFRDNNKNKPAGSETKTHKETPVTSTETHPATDKPAAESKPAKENKSSSED